MNVRHRKTVTNTGVVDDADNVDYGGGDDVEDEEDHDLVIMLGYQHTGTRFIPH